MNSFRTFLASLRLSGNRFDSYYERVLGQGSGYPTADEARRDLRTRDQQMSTSNIALYR